MKRNMKLIVKINDQRQHGNYFYTWFNGISYLIPVKECGATAFSLYLKDDAPKNLKNRVNFSKDYELTTTLKRDFQYNAAIV